MEPAQRLRERGLRATRPRVAVLVALEELGGPKPCLTAGSDVGTVDEAQVIFRGVCRACAAR